MLQAQLLQAQKMEAIGRLAGGVAHDFNNALSVIIGYGELILQKLEPGDPLREDVEEIVEAGKRSQALTRQLLAFSRRQTLQPKTLNLNDELRELEPMLRRLLGEDIDLHLVLGEGLGSVHMDPGQFDQTIMNLTVNAREALPRGGKLIIEATKVTIDESRARMLGGIEPGAYVKVFVTDSGHGMDETVLAHLFEPFFTTKEHGTGLGLATVYGIVKQSGGHITASSQVGKGSSFEIYFPQKKKTAPQEETPPLVEHATSGRGKHVLVVEDEEAIRRLLRVVLSRLGFQVSLAASGTEALLLVEERGVHPDLLITDMVMPDMNGTKLVERLRQIEPDLKVLLMSGYPGEAAVTGQSVTRGAIFIEKPFTLEGLTDKICRILKSP